MTDSDDRRRALEQIADLAKRHEISVNEIAAALSPSALSPAPSDLSPATTPVALSPETSPLALSPATSPSALSPSKSGVLIRVLGYLGGTFVFAGICVFVGVQWEQMNSAARIIVTLGSGLVAFVLAMLAAREERFDKATTPLLLIAAALEPTGLLVAFHELGSGGDWRWATLITFGIVALQFGGSFGQLRRSTPLFFTIAFATLFWWNALDLVDAGERVTTLVVGGSLMLAAVGVDRTPHRDITPVFYLFGATAFLWGYYDLVENSAAEITFLAVAAGLVYAAAAVHSRTLLFVATLAVLVYTGYYTSEHFATSVGWPLALIAFGMLMIGVSALAFTIDRKYVRV